MKSDSFSTFSMTDNHHFYGQSSVFFINHSSEIVSNRLNQQILSNTFQLITQITPIAVRSIFSHDELERSLEHFQRANFRRVRSLKKKFSFFQSREKLWSFLFFYTRQTKIILFQIFTGPNESRTRLISKSTRKIDRSLESNSFVLLFRSTWNSLINFLSLLSSVSKCASEDVLGDWRRFLIGRTFRPIERRINENRFFFSFKSSEKWERKRKTRLTFNQSRWSFTRRNLQRKVRWNISIERKDQWKSRFSSIFEHFARRNFQMKNMMRKARRLKPSSCYLGWWFVSQRCSFLFFLVGKVESSARARGYFSSFFSVRFARRLFTRCYSWKILDENEHRRRRRRQHDKDNFCFSSVFRHG